MTEPDLTRRRLLQASALTAAWLPIRTLVAGDPAAGATPVAFPAGVELYRQVYENWALEIRVDDAWTCAPRTAEDVVAVAEWARVHGWRVRPRGAMHGWSPFTVVPGSSEPVVLLDTTKHLTSVAVDPSRRTVTAGAGASLDSIMLALELKGLGWSSIPAPGEPTLAGAVAVNGHGAAMPGAGEDATGRGYGSLSNRVVRLKAVVWDHATGHYVERAFERTHPDAKALIVNLGRIFLTELTLAAESGVNLRCQSRMDLHVDELFAPAQKPGLRTFGSYLDQSGRVEAIWYPYTTRPWFKWWSVAPTKPLLARRTNGPYNYPFSDQIPLEIARLAGEVVSGNPAAAPLMGQAEYAVSTAGLLATLSSDLWGPARHTQHYIRPTTLRAAEFGWVILTSRANVQGAIHDFTTAFSRQLAAYRKRQQYPVNVAIELRCTGVDDPSVSGVPGAEAPVLSGCAPRPDRPEWDTAIWTNLLSVVGTPDSHAFRHEFEQWVIGRYDGTDAMVRVEWSKGWAFTDDDTWAEPDVLGRVIPDAFRVGQRRDADWDWAVARFRHLDPHGVFSNAFLDRLLV